MILKAISDLQKTPDLTLYQSVYYHFVEIDGVKIAVREAGLKGSPVLFLLHGYPSSSRMFRNVMERLASQFYVVAPDLPGFGFSDLPDRRDFNYSFDGYSELMAKLIEHLGINKASFYLFDYGAPVLMRVIARRPELVEMLIFQNGNIYSEGIGDVLKRIKRLFEDNSQQSRMQLDEIFELDYTRWEYLNGVMDISKIAPETYYLDQLLLERRGVKCIQRELKRDYKTNTALYPIWQKKLKELQLPTLIVWGENDAVFKREGALMLHRDMINSKLVFYPTGHFALEEFGSAIADEIITFWRENFNT